MLGCAASADWLHYSFCEENDRPRCIKCGNGPLVLAQGRSRWAFFQQRTKRKENGRTKDHEMATMVHGVQVGEEEIIHRSHCNTS